MALSSGPRQAFAMERKNLRGLMLTFKCSCVFLICLFLGSGIAAADHKKIHFPKLKNPYTGNPKSIAEGRTIFLESGCAKCHGNGATGGEGPNLTDDEWIIRGGDGVLFQTIQKGRKKRKGKKEAMPSWEEALEPEDIWKVIAWIRSIYKGDRRKIVWKGVAPPIRGTAQNVSPPPKLWKVKEATSPPKKILPTEKDSDIIRRFVSGDGK